MPGACQYTLTQRSMADVACQTLGCDKCGPSVVAVLLRGSLQQNQLSQAPASARVFSSFGTQPTLHTHNACLARSFYCLQMSTERAILGKDRHGTSEGCLWHILCSVLKVPQEAFYVRMPKKPLSAEQPRIYQCCHATMKADVLRSSEYKFRAWRDSHGW